MLIKEDCVNVCSCWCDVCDGSCTVKVTNINVYSIYTVDIQSTANVLAQHNSRFPLVLIGCETCWTLTIPAYYLHWCFDAAANNPDTSLASLPIVLLCKLTHYSKSLSHIKARAPSIPSVPMTVKTKRLMRLEGAEFTLFIYIFHLCNIWFCTFVWKLHGDISH